MHLNLRCWKDLAGLVHFCHQHTDNKGLESRECVTIFGKQTVCIFFSRLALQKYQDELNNFSLFVIYLRKETHGVMVYLGAVLSVSPFYLFRLRETKSRQLSPIGFVFLPKIKCSSLHKTFPKQWAQGVRSKVLPPSMCLVHISDGMTSLLHNKHSLQWQKRKARCLSLHPHNFYGWHIESKTNMP